MPIEAIDLQPDLRYQEIPIKILDTVTRRIRNSEVRICRVQWSKHRVEEATWEREDALKKEFPHLFRSQPNLEDEIHFKWGRFVTTQKSAKLNRAIITFKTKCSSLSSEFFRPISRSLKDLTPTPESITLFALDPCTHPVAHAPDRARVIGAARGRPHAADPARISLPLSSFSLSLPSFSFSFS